MGNQACSFQNTEDVLKRFGKHRRSAVKVYRKFIQEGIGVDDGLIETVRQANAQKENSHHSGSWVIGNPDFIRRVTDLDQQRRIRLARYQREGVSLGEIAEKVAAQHGLPVEHIFFRGKGNRRSAARKTFACIARREFEFPVAEIARFFHITSPSVSEMIRSVDDKRE
jgi:hypothetical protein